MAYLGNNGQMVNGGGFLGQNPNPGQPQLGATSATQNAGGFAGQGLGGADQINLANLNNNARLNDIYATNAGNQGIANTQLFGNLGGDILGGANQYNNTLASGELSNLNTVMSNETSPAMEANLWNQGVKGQMLQQFSPFIGQLMNSIGGALPGLMGGASGGGQGLPPGTSGPANSPIPLSVMNPYSAQGLINNAAGGTAASTANQLGAVTPPGATDALTQQLTGQGFGANRAGLSDATQSFLSQLAPANAQQALSGAQLAEGQRANYLGNLLARQQIGTQGTGNVLNFIRQLTGGLTGGQ